MDIHTVLEKQRAYFQTGKTLPYAFRKEKLLRLYDAVRLYEGDILAALKKDLGKSETEGFMCEIGMVLSEISYLLKHLKSFMRPKRVKTPLSQFAAKSYRLPTPLGNTLIMSPWNYPFLLTIEPLANAISAGNTAVLKPSAYSPATGAVIKKMLTEIYLPEYVAVVTGGRKENAALLNERFDFIFFTGSQAVGREVLRHTAETLTPAVLELGGKSPCLVDETAKISLAARRIVFGKFLNVGQTCVAPDYILCDERIKDALLSAIQKEIVLQFGEDPLQNPDYGRIVNQKHFDRILGLIDRDKIAVGGAYDKETLRIAPTVLDRVTFSDPVMQEEIFGPVLPVLTYSDFSEIYTLLFAKEKPLALYFFTEDRARVKEVTARIPYGGGCINDTVVHLASSELPFGGVGESGMGAYHGKTGFETFSHIKSVLDKKTWLDLPMRYQPYSASGDKMIRRFMK